MPSTAEDLTMTYDPTIKRFLNADPIGYQAVKNLPGRRVMLTGKLVRYADLDHGDSAADRLLSKRYYEGVQI